MPPSSDRSNRSSNGTSRWGRLPVRLAQFALDTSALIAAFLAAYLLRFEFALEPDELEALQQQLPWVVAIQLVALALFGVYRFIWRYIGMREIRAFLGAAAGSAAPLLLGRFLLPENLSVWRIPLSVIVIDTLLAFGGVLGLRTLRRAVFEFQEKRERSANGGASPRKPACSPPGRSWVEATWSSTFGASWTTTAPSKGP
jgi:hypothetical protein